MKSTRIFALVLFATGIFSIPVHAQRLIDLSTPDGQTIFFCIPVLPQSDTSIMPIFSAQIGLRPEETRFFDESTAFSGSAEIVRPDLRCPTRVAVLKGATRVEVDITQANWINQKSDPGKEFLNKLKKTGSAESINIFNPSKKATFLILPKLKVYLQRPIFEDELDGWKKWSAGRWEKTPKAEKVKLGEETIAGHPCMKYKFTISNVQPWEIEAAIVWSASDLQGCPIRIEIINGGHTNNVFQIKSVDPTKPEEDLFEPPKGFRKFDNLGEFYGFIKKTWPEEK